MPPRRILSLWFPRLAAEQVLRTEPGLAGRPLAVVGDRRGALVLRSLAAEAEAEGLRVGMTLGDARSILPGLVTRPEDPHEAGRALTALRRLAGRVSPWVAEADASLAADVTGCAGVFGGEADLVAVMAGLAAEAGFSLRLGLADTLGAAWAVARYEAEGPPAGHPGDAIDQEARATRSRAQKRGWQAAPSPSPSPAAAARPAIVPSGATLAHVGRLPVAALRLDADSVERLHALGLARIGVLATLPRTEIARRCGPVVLRRLDQMLGLLPEPVKPAPPEPGFSASLGFPEPVGHAEAVIAGVDRLLPPLAGALRRAGQGARRVRLTLLRTDGSTVVREAGLARPADEPASIRPLLALKLDGVDAGFGFERLRVEATAVEPVAPRRHRGPHLGPHAGPEGVAADDLADLIGRLGAKLGLDALVRLHPADSHIPEKAATEMAATFSEPAPDWPPPPAARPILLFRPEPVAAVEGMAVEGMAVPSAFRWRRRVHRSAAAFGPERITPEWWLDDPAWRSGPRDYWRVETDEGTRLWLFETQDGDIPGGWFAQGMFA